MANKTIDDFTPVSSLYDDDLFLLSRNGTVSSIALADMVRPIIVVTGTVSASSASTTINNSAIDSNMIVVKAILASPAAQMGDWTFTTASGAVTITGNVSSTTGTAVTLYLARQK